MSLDWDITEIKNYPEVCHQTPAPFAASSALEPRTQTIIAATRLIGMPRITATNAPEFYARLALHERIYGAFHYCSGAPDEITPEEIEAHIGLKTNAKKESRAEWLKHLASAWLDDSQDEYGRKIRFAAALREASNLQEGPE